MNGNIICFHNPDEEYGYLSNWYPSSFVIEGVEFSSMEQYMMYKKAVCFRDAGIASQIMKTDNVAEIKQLGRHVSGYDDRIWSGIRQIAVYEGLQAKFIQNANLKEKLLSTGNTVLAECAVKDSIWGIGLSMTNPDRYDMSKWQGQNLLGFALMMVREKLFRQ
ncbi:MAG: NADAR family protein [Clostridiales bacterium]|nr:NADAR family protein [Clostridiales bacterium]